MSSPKQITPIRTGRWHVRWIRAYLECLFDDRPVHLLEGQAAQLELILERP